MSTIDFSLLKPFLWVVVAVMIATGIYEVRFIKRPTLSPVVVASAVSDTPAPLFGLANVSFNCATQHGLVTSIQMAKASAGSMTVQDVSCDVPFTTETTRCPGLLPMAGFGDQIKCRQGEAIHCHGGPLQAVGLFRDDSFCGDVSDRDLGPPQEATRPED